MLFLNFSPRFFVSKSLFFSEIYCNESIGFFITLNKKSKYYLKWFYFYELFNKEKETIV